ncbi:mitochondrial branched-chain alpha-ketoacid dehydrogenase kinase-domain-containing protein [Obelidium mucronatum]|nr:mitochondrial branched-chain alpha-ketoacid dehydrogenase kinase-domain-containing protein [Obelidium mucronatum]
MASTNLQQMIQQSAKHLQTQVSLKQMVEFGRAPSQNTILRSAQFLHHELPIRLARRVVELENLPYNLSKMQSVQKVANWYSQSYNDLINFPSPEEFGIPKSMLRDISAREEEGVSKTDTEARKQVEKKLPPEVIAYNSKFVDCIENIKKRHDPVAITMAQGIQELKQIWKETKSNPILTPSAKPYDITSSAFRVTRPSMYPPNVMKNAQAVQNLLPTDLQSFLDRFYMSRIGIRMLIGQHVALSKASMEGAVSSDYVGIICTNTSIRDIVTQAADNAQSVLQDSFGVFSPPEIKLVIAGSSKVDAAVNDIEFMYVPSHLHHMLFELLKNSLRAIVETHGLDADGDYPAIKVIVAQGKEDITIKISDEGGGIPRSGMPLIWTYLYTTAEQQGMGDEGMSHGGDHRAPMAGFGYGLPLSRLYARYFGGDLKLISMDGYGTDAYLHLNRLSDSEEPLPY